jgi:hypothetical protein
MQALADREAGFGPGVLEHDADTRTLPAERPRKPVRISTMVV